LTDFADFADFTEARRVVAAEEDGLDPLRNRPMDPKRTNANAATIAA
jgi:hypothetical protein